MTARVSEDQGRPAGGARGVTGRGVAGLVVLLTLLLTVAVAACGSTTAPGSGSPSASPVPPSGPASGSGEPTPKPTSWPGTTPTSVVALGAGDGEIAKALADLQRSVDAEDPRAIRDAADGFVRLIDELQPNVDRLARFDHTKPLADAYARAFPVLREGATKIRDAIASGDSAGVVAGFEQVNAGMQEYAKVRESLDDLVLQALEQQRLYTK